MQRERRNLRPGPPRAGSEARAELRRRRLLGVALAVVVAYAAIGTWPVAPVEGDAEAIANSVQDGAGARLPPGATAYRFADQPGTYAIVGAAHRILRCDPLTAFAVLSAVAALIFVLLSAGAIAELTGVPLAAAALAMLAFQETLAGGYYANSTAVAAAAFMAGLLVALRSHSRGGPVLAGFLIGIAGWLRADVVLATPALLPALHRGARGTWATRAATTAAVALATALAASGISGVGVGDVLGDAATHLGGGTQVAPGIPWLFGSQAARSILAFLSPAWGLAFVVGAVALALDRRWRTLGVVVLGTLPLWLVSGRHLSSPKYLYLSIPFVVAAACAAPAGRGWRRGIAAVIGALLLLVGTLGVRLDLRSRPWDDGAAPGGWPVFTSTIREGAVSRLSAAIGPGTLIPTDDGLRLASGTFFAPLVWHRLKSDIRRCDRALGGALADLARAPVPVVTETWSAGQAVERRLRLLGFSRSATDRRVRGSTWTRGTLTVVHLHREVYGPDWDRMRRALAPAGPGPALYVAGTAREQAMLTVHLGARVLCACGWPTGLGVLAVNVPADAR